MFETCVRHGRQQFTHTYRWLCGADQASEPGLTAVCDLQEVWMAKPWCAPRADAAAGVGSGLRPPAIGLIGPFPIQSDDAELHAVAHAGMPASSVIE
jgi:hypothetical protein